MEQIQITEEQAWEIINVMHTDVESFMENLKKNGFIKKPQIEILKEKTNHLRNKPYGDMTMDDYKNLFNYINLLEKSKNKNDI